MGIDSDTEIHGTVDEGVLRWPKYLLLAIYAASVLWCAGMIFFTEMYEEEYLIRMIYMIIMIPLMGFLMIDHRWAMTSACTAFLCYWAALVLFAETPLLIRSGVIAVFLCALTWRAMTAADHLDAIRVVRQADTFD